MSGSGADHFPGGLRFSLRVRSAASLIVVATAGCAAPELESPATTEAALIGGARSGAERDAVVFVRANHPDGSFDDCTGTLLSPSVVATAKHCVTVVQGSSFVCTGAGALVEDGTGAGQFGTKLPPSSIEIHTGSAPEGPAAALGAETFVTASMDACHDDVAVIVLDRPLPQEQFPMLRRSRPTVVGESVRLVGYGAGVGGSRLIERTEVPGVRVLDVSRSDGAVHPSASTPSRSFVVPGGSACFGDSGGPALAMDTGALVGIYSRITGDCLAKESRNTFMLVAGFSELLDRAFARAAESVTLEPHASSAPPEPPPEEAEPVEGVARHQAFQCAFRGGAAPSQCWWGALVALASLGLSRRRSGPRPF